MLLSLIVIGYYLFKSDNYGGWTNGPRWLMWLSPFWLLTMLPIVDRLGQRCWGRAFGLVLLGILGAVGPLLGLEPLAASVDL